MRQAEVQMGAVLMVATGLALAHANCIHTAKYFGHYALVQSPGVEH